MRTQSQPDEHERERGTPRAAPPPIAAQAAPERVLWLQSTIGNAAVQRLLGARSAPPRAIQRQERDPHLNNVAALPSVPSEQLFELYLSEADLHFIDGTHSYERGWIRGRGGARIRRAIRQKLVWKRRHGLAEHLEWFLRYIDGLQGDARRKAWLRRAVEAQLSQLTPPPAAPGAGAAQAAEGAAEVADAEGAEPAAGEQAPAEEAAAAPAPLEAVREDVSQRAATGGWEAHAAAYDRRGGQGLGIEGLAPDWAGYLGQMREMDWLGRRVVGHEAFLTRLHRAATYLHQRYPGVSDEELVPTLNTPGSRSQWRAGERGTSYHVFGMAIDIAAGTNPWISNPQFAARSAAYHWAIWRAVWLAGEGRAQPVWPARSRDMARSSTTRQLWDYYSEASSAVGRYFRLGADAAALATAVDRLGPPPEQPPFPYTPATSPIATLQAGGAPAWSEAIAADRRAWPGERDEQGFMNLRYELVEALRDHAGLSWGGCDLGARESGDFMHFDLRTPEFEQMRNEIRRAAG